MVLNFLTPWTIFFVALILVTTAIIVLTVIERRLNKKIIIKNEEEEFYYEKKINAVRATKGNPIKFMNMLSETARDFFSTKYGTAPNMKYSAMIDFFKAKNKTNAMKFAESMQLALYSGDKLNENKLETYVRDLELIINNEKQKDEQIKKDIIIEEKLIGSVKPEDNIKMGLQIPSKENMHVDSVKTNWISSFFNDFSFRYNEWVKKRKIRKEVKKDDIESFERIKELQRDRSQMGEEISFPEKKIEDREIGEEVNLDVSESTQKELNVVPFEKTEIKYRKVRPRKKENWAHELVGGVDDLKRVEKKIEERKKLWAFEGVGN